MFFDVSFISQKANQKTASKPAAVQAEEQTACGALTSMLEALAQSDAIQAMERKGACFKTSVVQEQASSEEQSDVDKAISESLLAQQQRQHESRSAKRSRQHRRRFRRC